MEDGVAEIRALLDRFNELSMNYSDETADEFSRVQEQIDAVDGWNLDTTLEYAMDALRCPPADADVTTLSGGERRRVAMCRLLLRQPDLLLLDEPTNHLDAESVAWLEQHLQDYKGTIVAITHDRYFLDNVAGWILELDRGRGIPYQGNYSGWLEQKQKRLAAGGAPGVKPPAHDRAGARVGAHERVSARRGKPKARLNAYEALLAQDRNVKLDQVQIHIPAGPRLGDVVVEADGRAQGLRRPAADRRPHASSCRPAGIVGVIGPNGAGKTTLLRMITGQEQPDDGDAAARRHRRSWPTSTSRATRWTPTRPSGRRSPAAWTRSPLGDRTVNSRAYVAGFNFKGTDQQKKVAKLSGGERNRLHLAKLLRERRQPAAARRADQRPGHRHAARARGGAAGVRRLRGGRLPRSLVPGPHRHPRAGLRGRLAGALVRGQLRGLRELPPRAARRRGRPAAPHHLQEARPQLGFARWPRGAVLITGCSSGIGHATAERLLDDGHTVYATARRPDSIAALAAKGATTLALDVTDEASMSAAVAQRHRRRGRGRRAHQQRGLQPVRARSRASRVDDVRRQFETNVFGLIRMCQLVLPGMRVRGAGTIVNIGSMGGRLTFPGGGIYHATKYAVEAISDALRFEVRGFGVDVVLIEPGLIVTNFGDVAAGSVGAAGEAAGPYTDFNRHVAKTTADVYKGPMAKLGGRPGGGGGRPSPRR